MAMIIRHTALWIITLCLFTACAPSEHSSSWILQINIEKSNPERLLSFYFGGYVSDPFESRLLIKSGEDIYIDLTQLDSLNLSASLTDRNNDGMIEWEELEPFLNDSYYLVRAFPESLSLFKEQASFSKEQDDWLHLKVKGMMTVAQRHIYIKKTAVRQALSQYKDHNNQIKYPVGTSIIAEHRIDDVLIETTVMRKRQDGFWDFMVYDDSGSLAPSTTTDPKPLKAPTQCVGCHFGNKVFEPEFSFPSPSPDGPFGERGIDIDNHLRNEEITRLLEEHEKRNDTVLGLYGTIYLSDLTYRAEQGAVLTEEEATILEQFR